MNRASSLLKCLVVLGAIACSLASANAKPRDADKNSPAPAASEADPETAEAPPPPADGGVVLGRLPNPTLPAGACGMIVWMMDSNAPVPVLRFVAGGGAQVSVGGKTVELARIETNGPSNFGIYEKQKFTSGAGLIVEVAAEFGTPFEGGTWLQNGIVAIESADGWRSVAPVAGVAGCRAK